MQKRTESQSGFDVAAGDYGISLARVSDAVQTSIPEQHQGNRNRAALMGVPIPEDGFYSDVESRSNPDKWLNFLVAMERIKDSHCKFIFAWQDSRVFGDEDQFLHVAKLLRKAKVRLVYQDGHEQDVTSREGQFMGYAQGWMNHNEVIRTRKRVQDTHQLKAADGRLISRPPYGVDVVPLVDAPCGGACKGDYLNCPELHGELSKKNTVWVINEEEVANLLIMYRHMARGGTWTELEKKLASAGIVGKVRTIKRSKTNVGKVVGGIAWKGSSMKRLLTNPFYMGIFTWNRTQIVRDGSDKDVVDQPREEWIMKEHSLGPIIDPQLWEEANEWIKRRSMSREDQRKYPPLLWDGFIFDGRCGWKMSPRHRANRTKVFGALGGSEYDYVCHGVYNPYCKCIKNHVIPDRAIDHNLGLALDTKSALMPDIPVTYEVGGDDRVDPEPELKALASRLVALEAERENVIQLEIKGRITSERADKEYERITDDTAAAKDRQQTLLSTPAGEVLTGEVPAAIRELLPLLRDESIPLDERRLSISRVIDRIIVDRPGMRVVLRKGVADVAES